MKKMEFFVDGVTCSSCVAKIEHALNQVDKVEEARVSLFDHKLKVLADESLKHEEITKVVEHLGYSIQTAAFKKNKELSSPKDRKVLRSAVNKRKLNVQNTTAFKNNAPSLEAKNHLSTPHKTKLSQQPLRIGRDGSRFWLTLVTGMLLFYLGMGPMFHLPLPSFFQKAEGLLALVFLQGVLTTLILYLQQDMLKSGLKALKYRSPNMYSLVALGVLAAYTYSLALLFPFLKAYFTNQEPVMQHLLHQFYFESAGTILVLMRLGKYLEDKGKNRAKHSLKSLLALREHRVKVERGNQFIWKDFESLEVGDVLYMELGNRIPVDGEIIEGQASVDTSTFTGESLPRFVEAGEDIKAGSLVVAGFLKVKATQVGEDSSLSRMIARVLQATDSKAKIARLADRLSLYFVPTVLLLAFLGFSYWFVHESFAFALKTAVMVLIISCPCALGLAAPLAMMVGTGRAAKEGILFKNAEKMEEIQKLDVLILDKTGTLTEGKMELEFLLDFKTEQVLKETQDTLEVLKIAAFIEQSSQHPLSKAIHKALDKVQSLERQEKVFESWILSDFEEKAGLGVRAKVNEKSYALGNRKHIFSSLSTSEQEKLADLEKRYAQSILLYLVEEGRLKTIFAFSDPLKANAKDVLARLSKKGMTCILASGDRLEQVKEVAQALGLKEFYAECTPEFKYDLVKSYQSEGKKVAMVGDGINDAAALAQADLSIVMGEGAEISLETADVILLKNDLQDLEKSLKLSQAVLRNIKQNLFWAFIYNIIFIPVALGFFYTAYGLHLEAFMAALAMSLSDLFIITNALRLNYLKLS